MSTNFRVPIPSLASGIQTTLQGSKDPRMFKGAANVLVSYSSSDDDAKVDERPTKRRKLPKLSSSLLTPVPTDYPELHQGRIRTTPHVEGQWATHVYVSLAVETRSPLYILLDDVFKHAKNGAPTLNSVWPNGEFKQRELHISLSRPTYLWTHQRDAFRRTLKRLSESFRPFKVSFVAFSELTNDERTRSFLTMEVGAGHQELQALTFALTPTLKALRQKDFYSDARFHASFAWALLSGSSQSHDGEARSSTRDSVSNNSCAVSEGSAPSAFPTIPHLPKHLVEELNELHSSTLSTTKIGTFNVNSITAKIGKDIYDWPLRV